MDVDINFLPGDNNVTEEHLLRRLLFLGTVESALSLRGGCNKKGKQRFDLTQVGNQYIIRLLLSIVLYVTKNIV